MCLRRFITLSVGLLVLEKGTQGADISGATLPPPAEAAPVTLAVAEQRALERNADQLMAEAAVALAAAQLRSASEVPNPTLNFSVARIHPSGTGSRTVKGNSLVDRSYDTIVALTQLLEVGKRGPRRDSARAGYREAQAQRDDVRRLLVKSVAVAYVAALEAREESVILARSAASLRREADLAAGRLSAGDIASSDKAQIEITAAERELDAGSAGQAAIIAMITLETLLGDSTPAGQTQLADSLSNLALHFPSLNEDAPKTRSDVVAAEAAFAKTEADLLTQRRQVLPDISVSAQVEHNPPETPDTIGFAVGFPLPLWNRNVGGVRAARATRDQARAQLDKVRAQAAGEVSLSKAAYLEARGRAERYQTELVLKSTEVVQSVRYSYEHGGATLIELLTAERNDNDLRLAAARATADAVTAASALVAALDRHDTISSHPFPR